MDKNLPSHRGINKKKLSFLLIMALFFTSVQLTSAEATESQITDFWQCANPTDGF
jgi:hypothetical protein